MKNLLEQLNTEIKVKMEEESVKYSSIIELIKTDLEKNYFWTSVSFETVLNFKHFLDIPLDEFGNCFKK